MPAVNHVPTEVDDAAPVLPARPAAHIGLVVKIENDARKAFERGRHRRPECRGMIEVRHRLLLICDKCSGRVPVQIEDHVHPGIVESLHESDDCVLVGRTDVRIALREIYSQPAIFVQRNAHRVDPPGCDRRDRRSIDRAIEYAGAGHAHVLRTGAVDAEQAENVAVCIDQMIVLHVSDKRRGGFGDPAPWTRNIGRKSMPRGQGEPDGFA